MLYLYEFLENLKLYSEHWGNEFCLWVFPDGECSVVSNKIGDIHYMTNTIVADSISELSDKLLYCLQNNVKFHPQDGIGW